MLCLVEKKGTIIIYHNLSWFIINYRDFSPWIGEALLNVQFFRALCTALPPEASSFPLFESQLRDSELGATWSKFSVYVKQIFVQFPNFWLLKSWDTSILICVPWVLFQRSFFEDPHESHEGFVKLRNPARLAIFQPHLTHLMVLEGSSHGDGRWFF